MLPVGVDSAILTELVQTSLWHTDRVLPEAIREAMLTVNAQDAKHFIRHCGYTNMCEDEDHEDQETAVCLLLTLVLCSAHSNKKL